MSGFKPYPAYKDSGVEWLGEVPEGWDVVPIKRVARIVNGATPASGEPQYWDGEIVWYTPADLDNEVITELYESRRKITPNALENCAAKLTPPESVVLSTRAPVGSIGLTKTASTTNQGCRTLVPVDGVSPNYLALSLVTARVELSLRSNGTTFQELATESLASIPLPLPSSSEQTQIARFLDHETARIDALIAEQERLIELLKEKRQAVISHAVTKGLNPDVPMKDSGVEWLGQVPAHWEVSRVGWLCSVGNGSTPARDNGGYWDDGTVPWLNSSKANLPRVLEADQFVTARALKECALPLVKRGSVLMAITGEGKTRGMVTITEIEATINQHIAFITPRSEALSSVFLHDYLHANYARLRENSADWGSTKSAITCSDIRAYPVLLPPALEQDRICDFIAQKSEALDSLTLSATRSIELLRERRSALISAAVTGKIDVRAWRPPADAPSLSEAA